MRINPKKCVACGNCTYVCPMGAIYIDPLLQRATINRDECVECYACYNGLSQEHLNPTMVRSMRKVFQMMRLRFDPEPDVCPTAAFEPKTDSPFGMLGFPHRSMTTKGESDVPVSVSAKRAGAWNPSVFRNPTFVETAPESRQTGSVHDPMK